MPNHIGTEPIDDADSQPIIYTGASEFPGDSYNRRLAVGLGLGGAAALALGLAGWAWDRSRAQKAAEAA